MGKKKDKRDKRDKPGKVRKTDRKGGADRPAGAGKRHPLCKWDEDAFADATVMTAAVREATHFCRKCGRAANDPRLLCKPLPLA